MRVYGVEPVGLGGDDAGPRGGRARAGDAGQRRRRPRRAVRRTARARRRAALPRGRRSCRRRRRSWRASASRVERLKQVLEPAGAAALAAVLTGAVPLRDGDRVCVILSGGNVATDRLGELLAAAAAARSPRGPSRRGRRAEAPDPATPPPAAPAAGPGAAALDYDGAFVGPMVPPRASAARSPHPPARAEPVQRGGPRHPARAPAQLVGAAFDLLTRPDSGLRSASFYIGLHAARDLAPLCSPLVGHAARPSATRSGPAAPPTPLDRARSSPPCPRSSATSSPASRRGRSRRRSSAAARRAAPSACRESIAVARRRFWRVLAGHSWSAFATVIVSTSPLLVVAWSLGWARRADQLRLSLSSGHRSSARRSCTSRRASSWARSACVEAIQRSFRLVRLRGGWRSSWRCSASCPVHRRLFGLSIGADVAVRVVAGRRRGVVPARRS